MIFLDNHQVRHTQSEINELRALLAQKGVVCPDYNDNRAVLKSLIDALDDKTIEDFMAFWDKEEEKERANALSNSGG